MEQLLYKMVLLSPIGMAFIACSAIGWALTARQSLGKEQGLRAAAESARDAALRTLAENKKWEMEETSRFRRLLECNIDMLVAEATDFVARPAVSPGAILEGLCSWNPSWKRQLAAETGLSLPDVERLRRDELPITPALARKLELFTNAPAGFWDRLWRLHDVYRTETDQAVKTLVDRATRAAKDAPPRRPVLQIVDDGPTAAEPSPAAGSEPSAVADARPVLQPPPRAPRRARPELPGHSPFQRPAPQVPPLRIPLAPPGQTAQERASGLTNFPILRERPTGDGSDWTEVEGSTLNATLPGVGEPTT